MWTFIAHWLGLGSNNYFVRFSLSSLHKVAFSSAYIVFLQYKVDQYPLAPTVAVSCKIWVIQPIKLSWFQGNSNMTNLDQFGKVKSLSASSKVILSIYVT